MGHLTLVTGGSRSGKSAYALELAESLAPAGERIFLATAPLLDDEMTQRVRRHQQERDGRGWSTIEEPLNAHDAIAAADGKAVILLDCLTLWVNNRLFHASQNGCECSEDSIRAASEELLAACRARPGPSILVTNEVGFSIVPENPLARLYRDLVGRCNQTVARSADSVVLLCCGCLLPLKG